MKNYKIGRARRVNAIERDIKASVFNYQGEV
jgi:hypothetical protein